MGRDTGLTFDLTRDGGSHGHHEDHGHGHGCNRRDGSCGHGHHGHHNQPLTFGNQAFSQQTTGSGYNSPPAASYFPSSTPSPSYAAPAPFAPAAPSYSAPAPAPAPAPSYAPAPAPAPAPAYVAPVAQDEYGSPQAPVQDGYGSPQAPVSNGYAPPQPSYAASPGLQPLGFKVFVDGVILNSVGVWERFKDKIYPRIRVPDFILPLKLALFSPFLGIADKLQATFTPPVATQGYPHLKQRYWWWPTQWAAAKAAAAAARNKQQGAPA